MTQEESRKIQIRQRVIYNNGRDKLVGTVHGNDKKKLDVCGELLVQLKYTKEYRYIHYTLLEVYRNRTER